MARTRDGFTDMDWDKLKVFHSAAEAGSFTHAGEQLGLSQSAVSRQVSALEQELSVGLVYSRERPRGDLRVTTTVGLGVHWLTPRLGEFADLYPDVRIHLLTTDEE